MYVVYSKFWISIKLLYRTFSSSHTQCQTRSSRTPKRASTLTRPRREQASSLIPVSSSLLIHGSDVDRMILADTSLAIESGVNEGVTSQFPGSTVQVGGTLRGENPTLPDEAGGEFNKASGK